MNYTSNEDYEDSPEDWLFSALLFSITLGFLLKEGTGIIIDLKGDMLDLLPPTWHDENVKRVIVHSKDDQIKIISADERTDLKEGDIVHMIDEKILLN